MRKFGGKFVGKNLKKGLKVLKDYLEYLSVGEPLKVLQQECVIQAKEVTSRTFTFRRISSGKSRGDEWDVVFPTNFTFIKVLRTINCKSIQSDSFSGYSENSRSNVNVPHQCLDNISHCDTWCSENNLSYLRVYIYTARYATLSPRTLSKNVLCIGIWTQHWLWMHCDYLKKS